MPIYLGLAADGKSACGFPVPVATSSASNVTIPCPSSPSKP
jgi:hypothetical protein